MLELFESFMLSLKLSILPVPLIPPIPPIPPIPLIPPAVGMGISNDEELDKSLI